MTLTAPTDTDYLALLAAVLADPADDTPRLLLADWLLEKATSVPCPQCKGSRYICGNDTVYDMVVTESCHDCEGGTVPDGRAELAELIRIDCAMEAMGHDPFGCHKEPCEECPADDDRYEILRTRHREIYTVLLRKRIELPVSVVRQK